MSTNLEKIGLLFLVQSKCFYLLRITSVICLVKNGRSSVEAQQIIDTCLSERKVFKHFKKEIKKIKLSDEEVKLVDQLILLIKKILELRNSLSHSYLSYSTDPGLPLVLHDHKLYQNCKNFPYSEVAGSDVYINSEMFELISEDLMLLKNSLMNVYYSLYTQKPLTHFFDIKNSEYLPQKKFSRILDLITSVK